MSLYMKKISYMSLHLLLRQTPNHRGFENQAILPWHNLSPLWALLPVLHPSMLHSRQAKVCPCCSDPRCRCDGQRYLLCLSGLQRLYWVKSKVHLIHHGISIVCQKKANMESLKVGLLQDYKCTFCGSSHNFYSLCLFLFEFCFS